MYFRDRSRMFIKIFKLSMKNIFLVVSCCFISLISFSQASSFYVSGKVISAETKRPLQGASVFAENTMVGTATDAEGNFRMLLPYGGYNLVVTFTGFQTETKRINGSDANDQQNFELRQKEKELEAVSVVSTTEVKNGWEKYGVFFLEQFIGKTNNSAFCSIKNKDALKFFFSKKRNRLKVMATEPLVIENNALGYNIRYTLDSFTHEYATQVSLYTGYPLFEEKPAADAAQQLKWNEARQHAYKGSILHFMRSTYHQKLKEEGFKIQFVVKIKGQDSAIRLKNYYGALNYKKDDSTATVEIMPNQNEMGVIFTKEKPAGGFIADNPEEPADFQFSVLTFLPQHSITIEQNGYYFEQNELTINAYWTWDKIADSLPYDFTP